MPSFYALMGVAPTGFDPDHRFVTSWLLPPPALAFLRTLFALYCWANLIAVFAWDGIHDPSSNVQSFSYFTDLSWWGITFYLTIASVHTIVYSVRGYTWLDRWPRPLQVLHTLFYTTIVVFPFLVTIVYWALLYKNPWFPVKFDAYRNISRHAIDSLIALLEIFLSATNPPPFLHLLFIILILALYLALIYITYATQGFYTYAFLNPANGKGRLVGYVFGILIAAIIIFFIVWGLIWIRRKLTGIGKKSKKDKIVYSLSREDIEIAMK